MDERFPLDKNKFISPGENESVTGMCNIDEDFPGDPRNISKNDVPDSYGLVISYVCYKIIQFVVERWNLCKHYLFTRSIVK